MIKIEKKIEFTAHILIIVVALLIIGLLVQRYVSSTPLIQTPRKMPTLGKKISLGDFDWSKTNKNVLLVVQEGCHFCEESMDFYKRMIQQSSGKDLRIVAVFPPENKEIERYLYDRGVSGIEIRQAQFDSLEVEGTPTIIVTNEQGETTNTWRGKLSSSMEAEVLSSLNL